MVGVCSSQYEKQEVVEAFVLTASVTLALTLFTFQSRYDYSSWWAGYEICLHTILKAY